MDNIIKDVEFTIEGVRRLTEGVYEMTLSGGGGFRTAGQFMNISAEGFFLRRPVSICDYDGGHCKIIFRAQGKGTLALSALGAGMTLKALTPLGNGFDLDCPQRVVVIGGGIGAPPLYGLTKALLARGKDVVVGLGFKTAAEAFYLKEFAALGAKLVVTTDDGSYGERGLITSALQGHIAGYSYSFSCGPAPMLKAVYAMSAFSGGQYSLEERMGCGFGACMCCSINTKNGAKRVCADGPIFFKEDLLWI